MPLRRATTLAVLLAVAAPSPAFADDASPEQLLEQGHALMREGRLDEACPKLAESQRLAPSVAAVVALGDCYLKQGRIASAWVTFREAVGVAEAAGHAERARYARARVTELEPKLSRIMVTVTSGADDPELIVKRDGVDVDRAEWGTAIPVDPGTYHFEASAPGKRPYEATVTITAEPHEERVVVPALQARSSPVAPQPAAVARSTEEPASRWPAQRTTALVVGGVGVVALGVGSAFGLTALGHKSDASAHCPTTTTCDAEGYASGQDAHTAATESTVFFLLGGAAVGVGAYLWLTAPTSPSRVSLGVGPRGASLGGAW